MRRMLMSRCSFENPSSDERCLRTRSPSSSVTGRPPISSNLIMSTLAIVWPGGRVARRLAARGGGIATYNEMRAAMIFPNDRVPDRFARSTHPHGQRQQGELGRAARIFRNEQLITTHTREVVDVAGPRHADRWMNEQTRFDLRRRTER